MGEGGRPALDIYSTPQRVGLDLEEARASQQTPQQEVGLAIACSSHEKKKADATAQDPGHGQLSLAQLSQNFDQGPLYQGALVEDSDSRVLLTTYRTRNFPDIDIKVPTCPVGTMWDYYGQHKNFTWLAPPGISTAGDAQRWLHALPEDPWIGKEHKIWNPDALQLSCFTHSKHKAFLDIAYGDTVTAVSPPVFIWANLMRLTGTWCILATTYNTQPGNSLIMVQIEHTGLVPIAALVKHSGDEPIITHHMIHDE